MGFFLLTFLLLLIYLQVPYITKTSKKERGIPNLFKSKYLVIALLSSLIVVDFFLSYFGIVHPEAWLKWIHGVSVADTQGLMVRLGATWATFVVLQALALFFWKEQLWWLPLIAGVRLTEISADWFYLVTANNVSTFGKIFLALIPIANIALGIILVLCYLAHSKKK